MDKKTIRSSMKEKRLLLDEKTFSLYNQQIFQKVLQHPIYQSSQMIAFYVSMNKEVDTIKLIEQTLKEKRVCVPKVEGKTMQFYEIHSLNDLKEGHFHVLEPMTDELILPNHIDLIFVPMLAFDYSLYRVGYGKGYYDRYFQTGYQGYKLGLAFDFQHVDEIETNSFDIALDEIISETTTYK